MRVSIAWLKELVDLNCSMDELINLLPLRSISTKEVTNSYIELDMKGYNRADLLSMRGVAKEISAITGSALVFEEVEEANFVWNKSQLPKGRVEVQNPELAPFYTVTKIVGLKAEKSPTGWVKKLADAGLRSVDNITDITNLIMLEYGQPMHAFDAKEVKDEAIVVRTAKKGERITTLDGKVRNLQDSDLLIADSEHALGIAGVMGGKDSEVNENTTAILLEAAIFDPVNIRKTATRLNLSSEASKRFQHGLTKIGLFQALNAAIKKYQDLGGKITAQTFIGDLEVPVKKVKLTQEKINSLIGVEIKPEEVETYLTKLGFSSASPSLTRRAWEITVPYWRLDIELEEDLIEEVARMYGYEKIPAVEVSESKPLQSEDAIFQKISHLREKLVDLGLTEVQTYSFYSTDVLSSLGFNKDNEGVLIKVANPISAETEFLRMNLWPNLVEVVGKNIRKGFKDMAIFEIGKAFDNIHGEPNEEYRLTIALSNNTDNPLEELISLTKGVGLDLVLKESEPEGIGKTLFHPKRFIQIEKDHKQIGGLSEVHLRVLNKLGIEKRIAILEITL
ncbi:MAG: phenylalanine--tRNA ligase subunit beta [Candidatus Daviesbacteria bacterium]|nr:phenylalanine--tRNA ligase subunit beta [Candidatus Daviesbacteria bacterium]